MCYTVYYSGDEWYLEEVFETLRDAMHRFAMVIGDPDRWGYSENPVDYALVEDGDRNVIIEWPEWEG